MKIVIAGAGEVGTYLAKLLSRGNNDIILIDTRQDRLRKVESHVDLMVIEGSATSIEILLNANIKSTDLFIGVLESESANLLACSLAKRLGAAKTIARIDNIEYINPENNHHFLDMGIDSLIYPEKLASQEIVNLLHQSGTSSAFSFSGGKLSIISVRLDKNSLIVNKSLIDIAKMGDSIDFRIIAITRNLTTIIPRGSDIIRENDVIYVILNTAGIDEFMEYTGKRRIDVKNVMILGGSRIAKNTAMALESVTNVKIIEVDKNRCFELADALPRSLVINADGRSIDTLLEEGLANTDAFIAVTGNTDTNILSCLLAKQNGVKRTIAEIENIDYISLAEKLGVETIINKKRIAASHIFRFTTKAQVSDAQFITGTDAEALEFIVQHDAKITKKPLRALSFPDGAIVGGVIRGNTSFIATGTTQILAFDKVVVFVLPEAIDKIVDFFK